MNKENEDMPKKKKDESGGSAGFDLWDQLKNPHKYIQKNNQINSISNEEKQQRFQDFEIFMNSISKEYSVSDDTENKLSYLVNSLLISLSATAKIFQNRAQSDIGNISSNNATQNEAKLLDRYIDEVNKIQDEYSKNQKDLQIERSERSVSKKQNARDIDD